MEASEEFHRVLVPQSHTRNLRTQPPYSQEIFSEPKYRIAAAEAQGPREGPPVSG